VTRQLIGLQAANAAPNVWCGNIAPWPVAHETIDLLQEIGDTISRSCRLRGLFGCDFLLEGTVPRLTEINPRYTGSVELLEHLLLVPLLDWHRRACQTHRDATTSDATETEIRDLLAAAAARTVVTPDTAGWFVGKTILYARTDITATDLTRFARLPPSFALPSIADIPHPDERFRAGQPVCTLFASGPTWEVCLQKLERRAATCRIADAAACL
jgi:uncharacterized protein